MIAKRELPVCRNKKESADIFDNEVIYNSSKKTLEHENGDNDDLQGVLRSNIGKGDAQVGIEIFGNADRNRKSKKRSVAGGGTFQSMGLHPSLLRSLTLQGYKIPTPIQRRSIPILLSNPPHDLVGMARTGSGKTLAYLVPLIQKLGGNHSSTFGARALILIPNRELAIQILKVGKELTRGWLFKGGHVGDKKDERTISSNIRWGLIIGGESMDEQFEMISNNPDVIIATPGRLLHLMIEMNLDMKSIQYLVFDEADRLFEMGFETIISEIIYRLPSSRQTVLFSATLPKSLIDFTHAGLHEPKLVRLDTDSKISSDLRMAFFSVKQTEKEACLLYLLREFIKVPFRCKDDWTGSYNRFDHGRCTRETATHQTLIFVATKHHVEFVFNLLSAAGYSVSYIYGSLEQTVRTFQLESFRRGVTDILVVTDVAARGIDIPALENVVNYDFPQGARVFVHRVGRTARAGRRGWAWSLVSTFELPYLLDLQLSLCRPLTSVVSADDDRAFIESIVLGRFERNKIDDDLEYIRTLENANHTLSALRDVMKRGHILYERTKGKASSRSYQRAKEMMSDPKWSIPNLSPCTHMALLKGSEETKQTSEEARTRIIHYVNSFTPAETVFEIARKNVANVSMMKQRRRAHEKSAQSSSGSAISTKEKSTFSKRLDDEMSGAVDVESLFDPQINRYRDPENYLSHVQQGEMAHKGYSLSDNATFAQQVERVAFELTGDDAALRKQKRPLRWDKKSSRLISNDKP